MAIMSFSVFPIYSSISMKETSQKFKKKKKTLFPLGKSKATDILEQIF